MRTLPNIELIAANTILGLSYSLIVQMLESRIEYGIIFIAQITISAVVFIPIALLNPHRRQIARADILPIATCAVITIYGWSLLTLRGIASTSPIEIAAISTFGPTVTIVAAAATNSWNKISANRRHITKERLRAMVIPAILLLLVSIVILHEMPNIKALQNEALYSFDLTAVVCMGISTVIVANLQRQYGTTTILAIYFTVAILLLPILYPKSVQIITSLPHLGLSRNELLQLALLPLVTTTLPLYLLYRGSMRLTPLHTALYRYIQPVIAFAVIAVEAHRRSDYTELPPLLSQLATTLIITLLLLLAASLLMPKRLIK